MFVGDERKHAAKASRAAAGRAAPESGSARTPVNLLWQRLATSAQTKLLVSAPGDSYERKADQVAERVMRLSEPAMQGACPVCDVGGALCPKCQAGGEVSIQRQTESGAEHSGMAPEGFLNKLSAGHSLDPVTQAFMESRFGRDFGGVRAHTNEKAAESAQRLGARAYTAGSDIVFGSGQYRPGTSEGERLIAHELAHVVQQTSGAGRGRTPLIQRQPSQPAQSDPLTEPLTDSEWRSIDFWLGRGEVGIDPLTGDAEHNADLIAAAIFCERALFHAGFGHGEDPLLCVLSDVTIADPRVQALRRHVTSRGPIINWAAVSTNSRLVYVMELLVNTYNYPVNGAAGIVGNLLAESGVLPSRIEGSASATPMRAASFAGQIMDFSPDEVMNRSASAQVGPRMPGVGLAQWTTAGRRSGLFQRTIHGRALGSSILFNMDAQVEYLVSELQANQALNNSLTAPGITMNDASDNVVYQFEIPAAILDASGNRLPRADPAVQAVFATRRNNAQRALEAYQAIHPATP